MLRLPVILRSLATCVCLAAVVGCAVTKPSTETSTPTVIAPGAVVAATDIDRLTGEPWTGTLTYLDYTSREETTIKASLLVARLPEQPDGAFAWDMRVGYADEPHANDSETAVLADGGRSFRDAHVVERAVLADGTVRFVTEQDGEDDGRAARLRFVYLVGETQCSIQKLVRFGPDGAFFERHVYRWNR